MCVCARAHVQYILDVFRHSQWTEHISNHELLRELRMTDGSKCVVRESCRLGHVCSMHSW